MFNLKGRVAVVTGASSGLGADAARAYADCGADVALLARRIDKLEAMADELTKKGVKALAIRCDVTKEEDVAAAVKKIVDRFGRIDILLNNAGVAIGGGVDTISMDDWKRVMDVNVNSIFLMSRHVVPVMRNAGYGRIVNIASINATIADKIPAMVRHAYNTSKSAVLGLTKGMAASYGVYGITTNSIGPGLFESEMTENTLFKSDEFMNFYSYQNPVGRAGRKGELNSTIIYLSADESGYVNGQHIIVDGGISIV